MALVKCKECGAEISDQAAECPQCGKPRVRKSAKKVAIGCGSVIGGFIVLVTIIVLATAPSAPPKPSLAYTIAESFDMAPYKWQVTVVVPKQGDKYPPQADLEAIAKYIAYEQTQKVGPVARWWVVFSTTPQDKVHFAGVHMDKEKGFDPPRFAWNQNP